MDKLIENHWNLYNFNEEEKQRLAISTERQFESLELIAMDFLNKKIQSIRLKNHILNITFILRQKNQSTQKHNSTWNYHHVKQIDIHKNSGSMDYSGRYNGPDGEYRYNVEKWFASPANGFNGPS